MGSKMPTHPAEIIIFYKVNRICPEIIPKTGRAQQKNDDE